MPKHSVPAASDAFVHQNGQRAVRPSQTPVSAMSIRDQMDNSMYQAQAPGAQPDAVS